MSDDGRLERLIGQTVARFGFGSPPPLESMRVSGTLHAMEVLRDFLRQAAGAPPAAPADPPPADPLRLEQLDGLAEWLQRRLPHAVTRSEAINLVATLRAAIEAGLRAAPPPPTEEEIFLKYAKLDDGTRPPDAV